MTQTIAHISHDMSELISRLGTLHLRRECIHKDLYNDIRWRDASRKCHGGGMEGEEGKDDEAHRGGGVVEDLARDCIG